MMRGTVVDASLIAAPSSTKNESEKHDPEMAQTKKGNQWHFGMKAHIGVDADSGLSDSSGGMHNGHGRGHYADGALSAWRRSRQAEY
jgi:hypothetical protein